MYPFEFRSKSGKVFPYAVGNWQKLLTVASLELYHNLGVYALIVHLLVSYHCIGKNMLVPVFKIPYHVNGLADGAHVDYHLSEGRGRRLWSVGGSKARRSNAGKGGDRLHPRIRKQQFLERVNPLQSHIQGLVVFQLHFNGKEVPLHHRHHLYVAETEHYNAQGNGDDSA